MGLQLLDESSDYCGELMIPSKLLFGKYFSILHRQEQKHLNHIMQEYGLTSFSYPLLVYLYHNEGLNQRKLCDILSLDESLATRTMRTLETEGYIVRERDLKDQRSYTLMLTDSGKKIAALLEEEIVKWWSEVLNPLDETSLAILSAQMDKVSQRAINLNRARIDSKKVDK
ncbi:hypothetical protein A3206_05510 [Candidatus Methanomassiliicoccus intestinalis]|uniref:MarR family transcriptional regulator n=1 Tax=Methanomassiliicoccus intestinalis (strain Issoire-Mx1) TaxID=1295009 RepID=R9T4V0_METII|nr:MarR family transcriptional regulator [Candidatus Methanomassiliicoccus intestinalis]AGN25559.1 MarR family transcriptional regulator [Candidatus Methanomassiliicoccus intestinalis Issoire-Mx1]TQS80718.1 MAG: hypothetical protein A3206_05510 [Candidatus Methanomassiliicoccus intestinalis]